MKLIGAFLFSILFLACSGQESGETETLRFVYEAHTNLMIIARQATCYIFTLTDQELNQVHTDSTLRTLELSLLAELSDPNLVMQPVPSNALHTNLHKECGKGILKYYIIDQ